MIAFDLYVTAFSVVVVAGVFIRVSIRIQERFARCCGLTGVLAVTEDRNLPLVVYGNPPSSVLCCRF